MCLLLTTEQITAQERDNVGHRVGPWSISRHTCFKGLSWKLRKSFYSDAKEDYTNEIQIKNTYGAKITFSYTFSASANASTTNRKTLEIGEEFTSTYCPNVHLVNFIVTDVCFNGNCKNGCYASCDNGTPNQPNCDTKTNISSNSQRNQSTQVVSYNTPAARVSPNNQAQQPAQPTKYDKQMATVNAISTSVSLLGNLAKSLSDAKKAKQKEAEKTNRLSTATVTTTSNTTENYLERADIERDKDTDDGYRAVINILLPHLSELNGFYLNRIGFSYWKLTDYTSALRYYKLSAAKGENIAYSNIGNAYLRGEGVEIDKNLAYYYYMKVKPDYGDIDVVYHNIAHICEGGYNNDSNQPDYASAFSYLLKAANLGNADCMLHLGEYYDVNGKLAPNLELAKEWYQKACNAGQKDACKKLDTIK